MVAAMVPADNNKNRRNIDKHTDGTAHENGAQNEPDTGDAADY